MRFGDASPVRAVSFGNIPVEAMRPPLLPHLKMLPKGVVSYLCGGGGLTQGGREPDRRKATPRGGAFPSRNRARRSKQFFVANGKIDISPSPGPPPIALVSVLVKSDHFA